MNTWLKQEEVREKVNEKQRKRVSDCRMGLTVAPSSEIKKDHRFRQKKMAPSLRCRRSETESKFGDNVTEVCGNKWFKALDRAKGCPISSIHQLQFLRQWLLSKLARASADP